MNYIKSPLNYTGSKYKLLKQIEPLFPKNIGTFVDLFAGGCNVAVNADAKKVIANDIDANIIELYRYFKENKADEIIKDIEKIIIKYKLSNTSKYGYEKYNTNSSVGVGKYNKPFYEKLRADYNKNPTPLMFYITLIFAFNNQIRFNSKGEFNTPVNKRDFNKNIKRNLELFVDKLSALDITFISQNFKDIKVSKDSFVYIDPPYLITQATYNENGAWNEEKELELLNYMDTLDARGIKFALSNVFENKGRVNELLIKWSEKYKVHKLEHNYHNCNYQSKNKKINSTIEVLIINY
ncbi:Dam family site-specific DNA-(adenine-N6)-methyltransferase [Sulfurimonas sp.]|uniref:Dam family site-specific DNA-(adenine-N6)-methyltransferase n=1 Tax=Sulfurimonas sp. TaxID=2022749 RepID=UPI002AAF2EB7|nr:Dam family site-specific DNA-(adenine-N6)-methyltransferase [Sulfurimonas sp.]